MATYNEDVRTFIAERYAALGNASRHMRALHDARTHGKFAVAHVTAVRDTIADHLNEHHSADDNLPDLSTWTGANTPQRVYQAGEEHGLTATYTLTGSGGFSTITVTDGGVYTRPPTVTALDTNPFSTASGATFTAVVSGGEVTSITIDTAGSDYSVSTEFVITAAAPAAPASTSAQMADDDYVPTGWVANTPATDATTNRHVWRTERTGYVGNWSDWATPTLHAEYSA